MQSYNECQRPLEEQLKRYDAQLQAAIEITKQGNEILLGMVDLTERERKVDRMQGELNYIRGFDSIELGC